jgi:hypothetical protein
MRETRTSGLMSGDGKRGTSPPRPSSTLQINGKKRHILVDTLAQLAHLGGGFANFAGNAPSQLNGLAAISGRFARVVATKAIPFCSWI